MNIVQVELSKLTISAKNARAISASSRSDKDLMVSIRENGLIQNLVGIEGKDGQYEVTAGGRRLAALKKLSSDGHIDKDHLVPLKPVDTVSAVVQSLSENVHREPMNAVDEFRSMQTMIEEGLTETEIATRFNTTVKAVKKRLKLANVIEPVLKAYTKGKLDMECLMAFAGTDDTERQQAVWDAVKGDRWIDAYTVTQHLRGESVKSDCALARFVGVKVYEKNGGRLDRDLFSDTVYIEDPNLLAELAVQKLGHEAEKIEGWNWVEISTEGQRAALNLSSVEKKPVSNIPKPVINKLEKLRKAVAYWEEEFEGDWTEKEEKQADADDDALEKAETEFEEKYLHYSDETKSSAGCVVTFDGQSGELLVIEGLQRPEDRKQEQSNSGSDVSSEERETTNDDVGLSNALINDLGVYRQFIVSAELLNSPAVADDILTYALALRILGECYTESHTTLTSQFRANDTSRSDIEEQKAYLDAVKYRNKLSTEWMTTESPFDAFLKLSVTKKRAIKTYCVSQLLQVGAATEKDTFNSLEQAINPDYAKYWRPDGAMYFNRLKRNQLIAHGVEWFGEEWGDVHAKATKKELVSIFDRLFTGSAQGLSDVEKEVREKWLPTQIVFPM